MKRGEYIRALLIAYGRGNGIAFRLATLDERYADFKRRLAAAQRKR